jgi:hypothetical protein
MSLLPGISLKNAKLQPVIYSDNLEQAENVKIQILSVLQDSVGR